MLRSETRAACVQSFALWQQATIEIMRRNLLLLLARATYTVVLFFTHVANHISTQHHRRGCNTFRRQVVLSIETSTTIKPYFQQLLKRDLPNTKRFYKWNRKQLQKLNPLCLHEVLVKKPWLHITEDNDHPCCRVLIRALKTAQFAWTFVGNIFHAYKILWAPSGLFLRFCLLTLFSKTLLIAKTFWETTTVLPEYRDDCKASFGVL